MGLLDKARSAHVITWTNRYTCPPGYEFNDDRWIETQVGFPKITVSFLPHLVNKLGEYQLLLQNLFALRLLNDLPHEVLTQALWNRASQAMFGRAPNKKIFDEVVQASIQITEAQELPKFVEDILKIDTIWFAKDCKEAGRAAIKQKIRDNYISDVRSFMPVYTKYKTKEVMAEAEVSKYAVNSYWKVQGLGAKERTVSAIMDAYLAITDVGGTATIAKIAIDSGTSIRTLQRYKKQLRLQG